jgi:drug/metabolite transporter (DMT)-like permease
MSIACLSGLGPLTGLLPGWYCVQTLRGKTPLRTGAPLFADFVLLVVAFVWGTTFIVVKQAIAEVGVYPFLFLRFTLSFLCMILIFARRLTKLDRSVAFSGTLLGVFLFLAYAFQTTGLAYTSASNAGFITGLNVTFVPVLSIVMFRRMPAPLTIGGIIIATAGLFLLTGGRWDGFNRGDVLVLLCALCYALHILFTGRYAPVMDVYLLATVQIGVVALFSLPFAISSLGRFPAGIPVSAWMAVIFTGLLATVFAFVAQTSAQRFTPPARAALILLMESIFCAATARFYGGEELPAVALVGGLFMVMGMALAELGHIRARGES